MGDRLLHMLTAEQTVWNVLSCSQKVSYCSALNTQRGRYEIVCYSRPVSYVNQLAFFAKGQCVRCPGAPWQSNDFLCIHVTTCVVLAAGMRDPIWEYQNLVKQSLLCFGAGDRVYLSHVCCATINGSYMQARTQKSCLQMCIAHLLNLMWDEGFAWVCTDYDLPDFALSNWFF